MSAGKRRFGGKVQVEPCYAVIGARLKEARIARGVSQTDLATALNVSRPTITNWELGTHRPSLHMLAEIAEAMGCTLDDVITPTNSDAAESWRRRAVEAEALLRRIHVLTGKDGKE